MTTSRVRSNGVGILASGEPMIWLTGGMFAIACCMIASLLVFILFQGLSTHWQRPVAILPVLDDTIVAGEIIDEQAATKQLYIRTGNFDIGNRHFTYLPISKLAAREYFYPNDIWLIERREWGLLYGFPRRIKQQFSPMHDPRFRTLSLLPPQIDATSSFMEAFKVDQIKNDIAAILTSIEQQLRTDFSNIDSSTAQSHLIQKNVSRAMVEQSRLNQQARQIKQAIGRTDRTIAQARLLLRKVELAEQVDLQSIAEDFIQNAMMQGTVEAQFDENNSSLSEWLILLKDHPDSIAILKEVRGLFEQAHRDTMQSFRKANQDFQESTKHLKNHARNTLSQCSELATESSKRQYHLQQELARVEEMQKACILELQIPITQPGDSSLFQNLERQASKSEVALSPTHSLVNFELTPDLPDRWLVVGTSSENSSVHNMSGKEILVSDVVRMVQPNQLGVLGRLGLFLERWAEFALGEPREAGIEGGFFPALWGTIVMTLIMSIAVMPFGVMAALYMREYAKNGWMLSIIRISINNLAGVPSIVYGVFGLAFFCYTIGGYIDGGPHRAGFEVWPSSVWFTVLGLMATFGLMAFAFAFLGSGSPAHQSVMQKRLGKLSGLFWLLSLGCLIALLFKTPYFHGFYEATLPNPTFGKGCLLWASLTLALLTLPVVIVATEEALAAVPNSLREGSYACGAGKWQTLQRIVLPHARPGIITGFILAMARGAGEVAPMMLVGAIPLATDLPLDWEFPFFHGSRSFMHLGFQIYSLGFQSQNSEAAKPMVFTATLALLTIVTLLNITAIWLRARLRKRFQSSQF